MSKLRKFQGAPDDPSEIQHYLFFCPGCKTHHQITAGPRGFKHPKGRPVWDFNNDVDKPTFFPSHLTGSVNFTERRCHSYITSGRIRFLDDCHHELKGQTVELPI